MSRDREAEISILENLRHILATRQGSALTCPDYGIMEVSEVLHDFPDAIGLMQRSLKNSLQAYEPRLKGVQVRPVQSEDAMILKFEITGQFIGADGRKQWLRFGANIGSAGNVSFE